MVIDNFNLTVEIWIKELKPINFIQLCAKPTPASWSLGQVYMHLIDATRYFLGQVTICAASDDHTSEEMSAEAKLMFACNEFPNIIMEGPPSNADTPQPESKEELIRYLLELKEDINHVPLLMSASSHKGKTKHPGLNYFNAHEWFQFAEMHFRHHLRQKKRIDEFLTMSN